MNYGFSKRTVLIISISVVLLAAVLCLMFLNDEWNSIRVEAENKTGKTIICKTAYDIMANNSYMIISRSGKVVVMDPYDMIPGPNPDLITVSHLHGDHFDEEYVFKMKSRKSIAKVENIDLDGIKMISLASSHDRNPIDYSNPSNVIYYFEIDSLKIAHLGDFGQTKFTDKQKEVLRGIDVLIMPCQYNPVTKESINNILDDINPPIIFTTHTDKERLAALQKRITENIVSKEKYAVSKAEIERNKIKLVTLERNNKSLLFARYLVYKFTGSKLFVYILILILVIVIALTYYRRKKLWIM